MSVFYLRKIQMFASLHRRKEDEKVYELVAEKHSPNVSAIIFFFVHVIQTCNCRSKIFELRQIFGS
jgi:hypothetical protein